jgi:hypothetical protein
VSTGGTVTLTSQYELTSFNYNLGQNFQDDLNEPEELVYTHVSGTLPSGLFISNQNMSGTPNIPGTYNFTIRATDTGGQSSTQDYQLTILKDNPPTATGGTVSLTGRKKAYFEYNVEQNFNDDTTSTIDLQYVVNGTLPAGVTTRTRPFKLVGTPTGGGTFNFSITATDKLGQSVTQNYSLYIDPNSTPTSTGGRVTLASQSENTSFSYNMGINFNDDETSDADLIYTHVNGTLPGGLSINGQTLSGTLSDPTTYLFTIRATDTGNLHVNQDYRLTVNPIPGDREFTTPGTYTWTARRSPVCVVCVGGGGSGFSGGGGGGGGLVYKNNINVTIGQNYTIVVGRGGPKMYTGFVGGGGSLNNNITPGLDGRYNGNSSSAFGISATGGQHGRGAFAAFETVALGGSPGGGSGTTGRPGGGGGGAAGYGANGTDGGATGGNLQGGQGINLSGTLGAVGSNGIVNSNARIDGGDGGIYGAGGGSTNDTTFGFGGAGAGGAVRIIWGVGRSFPNNASDIYPSTID